MRTTVDLPDALFRKTKAIAALQGSTMKDLIVRAVEREVQQVQQPSRRKKGKPLKLPLIPSKGGPKIDLSNFNFDDLLA